MTNIILGTTLKAVNNGETSKVIKVDEKAKTAIIELTDGSTKNYSFASLKDKRRFIITGVEEPVVEEEVEEKAPKKSGAKSRITITYNGETKTPGEWAEEFGMNPKKIRLALRKGKTPDEIFKNK